MLLTNKTIYSLLPALVLAALALSACQSGGEIKNSVDDKNNQAKVVAAVGQKYLLAQRAGDWQEMCRLIDSRSQQALASTKEGNKLSGAQGCTYALNNSPAKTQQALRESTDGVKIIKSSVRDQQGQILAKTPSGQKVIDLSVKNGQWRIALAS